MHAAILEKLNIQQIAVQEYRLADGSEITRKKGIALFKYGNKVEGANVVFGEPDDSVLLGTFSLESLGLALDPIKQKLIKLHIVT